MTSQQKLNSFFIFSRKKSSFSKTFYLTDKLVFWIAIWVIPIATAIFFFADFNTILTTTCIIRLAWIPNRKGNSFIGTQVNPTASKIQSEKKTTREKSKTISNYLRGRYLANSNPKWIVRGTFHQVFHKVIY